MSEIKSKLARLIESIQDGDGNAFSVADALAEELESAVNASVEKRIKAIVDGMLPAYTVSRWDRRKEAVEKGPRPLRVRKADDDVPSDLDRPLENAEALLEIAIRWVNDVEESWGRIDASETGKRKLGVKALKVAIEAVKAVSLARMAQAVEWNENEIGAIAGSLHDGPHDANTPPDIRTSLAEIAKQCREIGLIAQFMEEPPPELAAVFRKIKGEDL